MAMEIIYYSVAGLVLYVASDWILNQIEIRRGERFPNRSIIFFGIILVLAMGLFGLIQSLAPKPEVGGAPSGPTQILPPQQRSQ